MVRLTEVAHSVVRAMLKPGEIAIDATAGNGHDTRFLCERVGPTGRVFAFDIQQEALARTAVMIGKTTNVTLIPGDHASLSEVIPMEYQGRIGAIMFNLGYLPCGNKLVVTQTSSTISAVAASLKLLRPGGVLTVLAYTGHPGGVEEAEAVGKLLSDVSRAQFAVQKTSGDHSSLSTPLLFVVEKATIAGKHLYSAFRNLSSIEVNQ
jgi:predicted methyltransferase